MVTLCPSVFSQSVRNIVCGCLGNILNVYLLFICWFWKCAIDSYCVPTRHCPGSWGHGSECERQIGRYCSFQLFTCQLISKRHFKMPKDPGSQTNFWFQSVLEFSSILELSQLLSFSHTPGPILQQILSTPLSEHVPKLTPSSHAGLATIICHLDDCARLLTGLPAINPAATGILSKCRSITFLSCSESSWGSLFTQNKPKVLIIQPLHHWPHLSSPVFTSPLLLKQTHRVCFFPSFTSLYKGCLFSENFTDHHLLNLKGKIPTPSTPYFLLTHCDTLLFVVVIYCVTAPLTQQVYEDWDFCLFCFMAGFPQLRTVPGTW